MHDAPVFSWKHIHICSISKKTFRIKDPKKDLLSHNEFHQYLVMEKSIASEWLLGRYVAKKVLNERLFEYSNMHTVFSNIEIIPHYPNKPTFKIHNTPSIRNAHWLETHTSFSISHTKNIAIAICGDILINGNVGVDIEKIRFFSESTLCAFLTYHEYIRYKNLSRVQKNIYATALWCIKEAYTKAIGVGLRFNPLKIETYGNILGHHKNINLYIDNTPVSAHVYWKNTQKGFIIAMVSVITP